MWVCLPSLKRTATLDLFAKAAVILQIANASDECHEFSEIFHAVNVSQKYVFQKIYFQNVRNINQSSWGRIMANLDSLSLAIPKNFPKKLQPYRKESFQERLNVRPRVNIFFDITSGTRNTPTHQGRGS